MYFIQLILQIFFPVIFSTSPLLLFFLLLFFLLPHCYFLSCYFFSCYFFSVTFFPVTFFPTIPWPGEWPKDTHTIVAIWRHVRWATFLLPGEARLVSPGLGSIQFRNWNCSSIPIPIPELELELKLVELKMELELKTLELELELKTGIEFFSTATAAITS